MKTSGVVSAVVAVHAVGIGALLLAQGCGTRQPKVEPPPAPVLPPRAATPAPAPTTPAPLPPPARFTPAPKPLPEEQTTTYIVQPGDTLSRIAQRHGVSAREIVELNKLEKPDRIRVGQKLTLPSTASAPTPAAAKPSATAAPRALPPGAVEYRVMPGDTLSHIAVRYGVKVSELREANDLTGDRLEVGQRLIVPHPRKTPPAPAASASPKTPPAPASPPAASAPVAPARTSSTSASPPAASASPKTPPAPPAATPDGNTAGTVLYTAREGDTLAAVARDFMVSEATLRRVNNLAPEAEIKPGQKILIPLSE